MIHNLEKIVLQAKHSVELAAVKNQLFESEQQKSDFALIKETLFLLAKRNKVADLIADCLNMCRMLFAPERVTFTFCNAETAQKFSVNLENQNVQDIEFYKENLKNGTKNWCLTKGEDGFAMRVSIRNQNCGILIVERVQFVEKLHHYLNLGLHIVNVFGLTMDTISQYERVEESEQQLQIDKQKLEKALQDIKTLRGLIPICSYCKSIRDDSGFWNQLEKYIINNSEAELSHGICPDCAEKICPELDMDKYRISEDPLEYTI
jgi:hypothetical protein